MESVGYRRCDRFGWEVPLQAPGVEAGLLNPRSTWADGHAFDEQADDLANRFNENFAGFASGVSDDVLAATPKVLMVVN